MSGVHGKAVMTRARVPGGAEHICDDEREDSSCSLESVVRGVGPEGRAPRAVSVVGSLVVKRDWSGRTVLLWQRIDGEH